MSEKPWEIKTLEPNGIFLEDIGHVYIYHQTWSIITRIENPNWTEALKFVNTCENMMVEICSIREQKLKDGECHHWEQDINLLIQQIQERSKEIDFFFGKQKTVRRKRGLINAGGWILNKVFGTMDSEEAEGIYKRLDTLEKHEAEQLDLAKKQITLIKSNFEQLVKPIKEIENEQIQIVNRMNKFMEFVNRTNGLLVDKLQKIYLQVKINDIAAYILMRLNAIFQKQTDLFTIFNALNSDKLHPLILRPADISTISLRIRNYLNKGSSVLDYQLIKQMLKLETYHVNEALLVKIKIPLPELSLFNISKVYVIPRKLSENQYSLIDTKISYFLNSTTDNQTVKFTKDDFRDNCEKVMVAKGKEIYLCYNNQPRSLQPESKSCPFVDRIGLPNTTYSKNECAYRILVGKQELLVKLISKNKWFFNFEDERVLQSTCDGETRQVKLIGQGIIKLFGPCIFTIGNLLIPFENDMEETGSILQLPEFDNFMPTIETKYLQHLNSTSFNESTFTITGHSNYNEIFDKESKSIAELERDIDEIENKRRHENNKVFQIAQFSVGGVVILILLGLIILKCASKRKNSHSRENKIVRELEISRPIINTLPRVVVSSTEQEYEMPRELEKIALEKGHKRERSAKVTINDGIEDCPPQQFIRKPIRLTIPKSSKFQI